MKNNTNARTERIYDEWLVLRCQSGDRAAITALAQRWQKPMLQFATVVTGQRDLAHEAVQDAWLAIIRSIHKLRDPARCQQWMFRIVHNKCVDCLRAAPRAAQPAEEPEADTARMDGIDNRDTVLRVLKALSEDHRTVLALHYLYDMEVNDIAASLDIPAGTVKSRLFNARESFRSALETMGDSHERPGSTNSSGPAASQRPGWAG